MTEKNNEEPLSEGTSCQAAKPLSAKANMIWNAVGSLTYLGAQWLITVLVVRLSSGYDDAGLLALGMSVSNIFTPIGYYKIRAFQVSDLDREYSFGNYLGFRIVTIAISALVMVVYGCLTCPPTTWAPVFLYGIFSLGSVFADVLHGEDQLKSRMDYIGVSFIARGVLSLASFIIGMTAFKSLDVALILMIITTFLEIAIYDVNAVKKVGVRKFKADMNAMKIRSLFIRCFPLVVALFFCSAVPALPRQLLNNLSGEAALGVYSSIASPILVVQMSAQYIYSPLLTKFAEYYRARQTTAFVRLLLLVSLGMAAVAIVFGILLALVGEPLFVLLYGESIVPYMYLILPLVICTVLVAYIWCLGDVLIVMRRNTDNLIGYALAFFVMAACMYPMISVFDMNGVSFTVIVAYGAGLVFFGIRIAIVARRHMGRGKAEEEKGNRNRD